MSNITLDGLSRIMVMAFVAVIVILPSGNIYSINVKIIITGIIFTFYYISLFYKNGSAKHLYSLFTFVFFISFYSIVAIKNNVELSSVISHGVAFASLFSAIYFPLYFVSKSIISREKITYTILLSIGAFSLFKIFLEIIMLSGIPMDVVKGVMEHMFKVSFIGLDAGAFYRIHFPSDYLIPLAVYAIIKQQNFGIRLGKFLSILLLGVITISAVLSYSRYLWFFSGVSYLFALLINKEVRFKVVVLCILFPVLVVMLATENAFSNFIEARYFGVYAHVSDSWRDEMEFAILNTVKDYIIFGRGLGSGAIGFTNIEEVPWYFELQWLAFVMQFGVIGAFFIVLLSFSYFKIVLKLPLTMTGLGLSMLYILWLMLGLFNGFMTTSVGGVVFLGFILLGKQLISQQRKQDASIYAPN